MEGAIYIALGLYSVAVLFIVMDDAVQHKVAREKQNSQ